MIVCHCMQLSDRAVRAAVHAGAQDLEQVAAACGAGECCGGCKPLIAELVAEERVRRPSGVVRLSLLPSSACAT
jgi:bacterioferritin-associated ferredoxin